jgi:hypothetical protein
VSSSVPKKGAFFLVTETFKLHAFSCACIVCPSHKSSRLKISQLWHLVDHSIFPCVLVDVKIMNNFHSILDCYYRRCGREGSHTYGMWISFQVQWQLYYFLKHWFCKELSAHFHVESERKITWLTWMARLLGLQTFGILDVCVGCMYVRCVSQNLVCRQFTDHLPNLC